MALADFWAARHRPGLVNLQQLNLVLSPLSRIRHGKEMLRVTIVYQARTTEECIDVVDKICNIRR